MAGTLANKRKFCESQGAWRWRKASPKLLGRRRRVLSRTLAGSPDGQRDGGKATEGAPSFFLRLVRKGHHMLEVLPLPADSTAHLPLRAAPRRAALRAIPSRPGPTGLTFSMNAGIGLELAWTWLRNIGKRAKGLDETSSGREKPTGLQRRGPRRPERGPARCSSRCLTPRPAPRPPRFTQGDRRPVETRGLMRHKSGSASPPVGKSIHSPSFKGASNSIQGGCEPVSGDVGFRIHGPIIFESALAESSRAVGY